MSNHPHRDLRHLSPSERLIRQAWKSAQVFVNPAASPSQLLTAQRQLVNGVRRYTKENITGRSPRPPERPR